MTPIAALPMYDWPERRAEVDAQWLVLRDRLRATGFDAPDYLTRRNGDLPPVPGGIRDASGAAIAPDPATLPPDELDLPTLWRHPALLLAQTCWGPMELGLAAHVHVAGQDDYSGVAGGDEAFYSSALVMRRGEGLAVPAPRGGEPVLPVDRLRGKRLAFNSPDSMSACPSKRWRQAVPMSPRSTASRGRSPSAIMRPPVPSSSWAGRAGARACPLSRRLRVWLFRSTHHRFCSDPVTRAFWHRMDRRAARC